MAATTSNPAPRKNGFDFAALTASAGKQDSADEVARLRAALETLAELVIAHGVMDARTLESIVGDLIAPPMMPRSLAAPLPPPAPSAAEALLRGPLPKPAPVATRPVAAKPVVAARPAPAPVAKAVAQPAPVAQQPVAQQPTIQMPAPVAAKPAPVAQQPVAQQPVVQQPTMQMPAPVAAQPAKSDAELPIVRAPVVHTPVVHTPVAHTPHVHTPVVQAAPSSPEPIVPPSPVQPVVASPFPAAPEPKPRRNPFDAKDATRLEAELTESPSLQKSGFFSRLFRPKTSPAQVAAKAASIEFTERVPKLPVDGLYAEQQRATELSFPPPSSVQRKPRAAAAAPRKKSERPADAAPARFCDRCWRRMDANGTCKTCSPQPSA
ncbi:MAG TPA: hypothetical protein VN947_11060 [Polyangia bacterium]|nr:hypothetical protein [Polyangia bacterium]